MSGTTGAGSLSEPVVYRRPSPAIYGTPDQFAALLNHLSELVDREPPETFASPGVRRAARHLAGLLNARVDETAMSETVEGDG